jgi:hypothetical protein
VEQVYHPDPINRGKYPALTQATPDTSQGVCNSKFVVAINHDASAAVFSQADVGVVDDWKVVLEAMVTNIHADCQ